MRRAVVRRSARFYGVVKTFRDSPVCGQLYAFLVVAEAHGVAADRGPNYEKYYKELKQRHGSRRSAPLTVGNDGREGGKKAAAEPLGTRNDSTGLAVKSNYYRFARQLSERFENLARPRGSLAAG